MPFSYQRLAWACSVFLALNAAANFAHASPIAQKLKAPADVTLSEIVKKVTQVGLSKASISFPSTYVGKSSEDKVIVHNMGTDELVIYQYSIDDAVNFGSVADCKEVLAPGESCEVTLQFNPTVPGMHSTKLMVESSATGHPVIVSLFGKAVAVTKTVTPDLTGDIYFDVANLGEPTQAKKINLRNKGNNSVTIGRLFVENTDSFHITEECNRSIAPNESCEVSITATPKSIETVSRVLKLESDSTQPFPLVTLHTQGKSAVLSLGEELSFGAQNVGGQTISTVTVKNTGNDTFSFFNANVIQLTGSDFQLSNTTCKSQLAAGSSCEVAVMMVPTKAGHIEGRISAGQYSVSLKGVGHQGKGQVLPNHVKFQPTKMRVMSEVTTLLLSNQGDAPLKIKEFQIAEGQAHFSQSNDCPKELEVGAACRIALAMTAATSGQLEGVLAIKTNGPNDININLSGIGLLPEGECEVKKEPPPQLTIQQLPVK